jgi:anti-sigma regulatory factor (Ser/Thr protein kinase)
MPRTLIAVEIGVVTLRTPPLPSAPERARDLALAMAAAWRLPVVADELALVVGELTANAVRWAGTRLTVTIRKGKSVVRVEVADRGADLPRMIPPARDDEGHRGLIVVAALSARWGCERHRRGKAVWAEFDLPPGDVS